MNKEEYVKKKVVLYGYGILRETPLNAEFFRNAEKKEGEIENILKITKGLGGIGGLFGSGEIEGCIIVFKNGSIFCAESDGEYVDIFMAKEENETKKE
jgi:hypothetical protein